MGTTTKTQTKYDVTVATSSGSSSKDAPGEATVESVIRRAFHDLGIKTPLDQFTFENEGGTTVTLQQKVNEACTSTTCKIFANPKKAADA